MRYSRAQNLSLAASSGFLLSATIGAAGAVACAASPNVAVGYQPLSTTDHHAFSRAYSFDSDSLLRLGASIDSVALEVWLLSYYETAKSADSVPEIMPLVKILRKELRSKRFELLSGFLERINFEKFSVTATMTLIRTIYASKGSLKNWEAVLNRARNAINSKGYNPSEILHGIEG